MLRLPGNTPFRGPQQVQQSFITNNQVRPDLTLFNSQDSQAVFGNLLTLPIGDSGLLYVEPLYVQGPAENSFPLLQKVLVNYGDRVGYADTLEEALDQVFGAGAGESAAGSGTTPPRPAVRRHRRRQRRRRPRPPDGGGGTSTNAALDAGGRRHQRGPGRAGDAQRTGDFAGQGQALEDLQTAVDAYQAAQGSRRRGEPHRRDRRGRARRPRPSPRPGW